METVSFPWPGSGSILLQIDGNLKLLGSDRPTVEVQSSAKDQVELSHDGDTVHVRSKSNCTVLAPSESNVILEEVNGNAQVSGFAGNLQIVKIGGNLNLSEAGSVEIEKVYGNLTVNRTAADLHLQSIYGNTRIRQLAGRLTVQEAIKGNLILEDGQGAQAAVLGNATLSLNPPPGAVFEIKASGNIHCQLPENASATVSIETTACNIRIDHPQGTTSYRQSKHELSYGLGEAQIKLSAKGYVHLASYRDEKSPGQPGQGKESTEVTEEISDLIDEQMAALEQELNERLAYLPEVADPVDLSTDIDEIVEQARQYSTRAAVEAQARVEAASQRAQEKLARKLEKARRRAERQAKKAAWQETRTPGQPSPPGPVSAAESISDEERLLILKMLEEGKITLEEADNLLAAIEGD